MILILIRIYLTFTIKLEVRVDSIWNFIRKFSFVFSNRVKYNEYVKTCRNGA